MDENFMLCSIILNLLRERTRQMFQSCRFLGNLLALLMYFFVMCSSHNTRDTGRPNQTDHAHLLSDPEMVHVSALMDLAFKGKYPGTNHTRKGRRGAVPVWNQRTSILYYNRKNMGEPVMWLSLSMGVVANARALFSNKKTWLDVWEYSNPDRFHEMEKYIPRTWSDTESFEREMDRDSVYVYKPVYGYQGRGISFARGSGILTHIHEEEEEEWVVQEFVNSFLYKGKKNHIRVVTMVIVQPDGSRQFFIYKRMRLYTAAEKFDESRLVSREGGDEDVSYMLLTNLHQNEVYFNKVPENKGKEFSPQSCLFDTQSALEGEEDIGVTFEHVFEESVGMHSIIYSIIGDAIECKPTDVSVYGDACFHLVASDISFDKHGSPTLLEMNHRMGMNALWSPEEQREMGDGVASMVKGVPSPYNVDDATTWVELKR